MDSRRDRWLAGVTLSQSMGEGVYTHPTAAGGGVSSTLTSLNPYVHYRLNERTSFWGVAGYGVGGLKLTPDGVETGIETDMATTMAAFGGRGVLSVRTGGAGRFELALRSDALLTNTDSEAVQGLAGAQGATSRVRLVLEGSGSLPVRRWRAAPDPGSRAALRRRRCGDGRGTGGRRRARLRGREPVARGQSARARRARGHRIRGMGVQRFGRLHPGQGRARAVDEARFGLGFDPKRRAVAVEPAGRERSWRGARR